MWLLLLYRSALSSEVWQVICVSEKNFPPNLNNVKKARYIKTHPHIFLGEYDKTIWVDANLILLEDPLELVDDAAFKLFKHPFRACIYKEAEELLKWGIDSASINRWIPILQADKYPQDNGLVESNFMIRDNSFSTIDLDEKWWEIINRYSYRDQLSLNYLIWKYKYKVVISDVVIRYSKYVELIKHNGR